MCVDININLIPYLSKWKRAVLVCNMTDMTPSLTAYLSLVSLADMYLFAMRATTKTRNPNHPKSLANQVPTESLIVTVDIDGTFCLFLDI